MQRLVMALNLQLSPWLSLQTAQYQIVPGQVILYNDFVNGQSLLTLLGERLTVRMQMVPARCTWSRPAAALPCRGCQRTSPLGLLQIPDHLKRADSIWRPGCP